MVGYNLGLAAGKQEMESELSKLRKENESLRAEISDILAENDAVRRLPMTDKKLVVFEGPDGSGKSTQARIFADRLIASGVTARLFREPGATPAGERIREILKDPAIHLSKRAMLLLFEAARASLCDDLAWPALKRGETIILDRFILSTFAYQGYGYFNEENFIRALNTIATDRMYINLTFLLDVPVEVTRARMSQRDRFEGEGVAFMERVREGYLYHAKEDANIVVIDGTQSVEAVAKTIWSEYTRRFGNG